MRKHINGISVGMLLKLGASVLAAARAVDARLVEARLATFERVHRDYVGAQRKVETAESVLRAARARLADCDAVQDQAVGTWRALSPSTARLA